MALELPHLHTATLAAFVKVGSRHESAADNGLSHFVEHMLFRGTERYPTSYELSFAIESLGSGLHAETGRDDSLFQIQLEATEVEAGLALFGELFGRPRFADIELERALILEELSEDYDPGGVEVNVDDIARGLMFDGHPLAQRIIGPRANVRRFTIDDVQRHFADYYGAANTIVCVAGPIDPAVIEASARAELSFLAPGRRAETPPAPRAAEGPLFRHVRDRGGHAELNLLIRALPETDPEFAVCAALLRTLDDGMATRLHYRLCDQLGLAYTVNADLEPLCDVTLLDVVASAQAANLEPLVTEILAIFDELRARPIPPAELEKIKRRYRYELQAAVDDPSEMAAWYGGAALHYPPMTFADKVSRMDRVTAAQICDMARRILSPRNLAVAVVGDLSRAQQRALSTAISEWQPS